MRWEGDEQRGAHLYIREEVIVDKLCGANAGVGVGDADVLCLCISPMAAEAILIATTMGADRTSEFAQRRSSTAWRFPGVGRVSAVSRRLSLSRLRAQTWRLSGSGCPDLDSELLDGERVAQKGVPSVFPRRSHRLIWFVYSLVPSTRSRTKLSSPPL